MAREISIIAEIHAKEIIFKNTPKPFTVSELSAEWLL
jgi:hypothetical protein